MQDNIKKQISQTSSERLKELGLDHETFSPISLNVKDFEEFPTMDDLLQFIYSQGIFMEEQIINFMKINKFRDIENVTKEHFFRNSNEPEKVSYLFETTRETTKNQIKDFLEPNYLTILALKAIKIHRRIASIRNNPDAPFAKEIQDCKRKQKIFVGLSSWRASHSDKYRGELVIFNPFKREGIIKNLRYEYLNKYTIFRLPSDYDIIPEGAIFFGEY